MSISIFKKSTSIFERSISIFMELFLSGLARDAVGVVYKHLKEKPVERVEISLVK